MAQSLGNDATKSPPPDVAMLRAIQAEVAANAMPLSQGDVRTRMRWLALVMISGRRSFARKWLERTLNALPSVDFFVNLYDCAEERTRDCRALWE